MSTVESMFQRDSNILHFCFQTNILPQDHKPHVGNTEGPESLIIISV